MVTRKRQKVMMVVVRVFLLMFMLLKTNAVFAQELDVQRYLLAGPGEEGFELVLKKGNKFEFTRHVHLGSDYGVGYYVQDVSRLILFYDSLERNKRPHYKIESEKFDRASNIPALHFKVLDEFNEPMFVSLSLFENDTELLTVFTDEQGESRMLIPTKKEKLMVKLSWLGYETIDIPLNGLRDTRTKITAHMSPQDTFYIESGRKEYRILEQKGFDVKLQDVETGTEYVRKRKWKED